MTSNTSGIRIRMYPTGIPDDALDRLRALIDEKFVPRAPRFAAMLLDAIDDEVIRRCRTRIGPPREPAMPTIETERWSDTEVAEALVTSSVAVAVVSDPAARTFMARVNTVVVALAAYRLERANLTNSNRKGE